MNILLLQSQYWEVKMHHPSLLQAQIYWCSVPKVAEIFYFGYFLILFHERLKYKTWIPLICYLCCLPLWRAGAVTDISDVFGSLSSLDHGSASCNFETLFSIRYDDGKPNEVEIKRWFQIGTESGCVCALWGNV